MLEFRKSNKYEEIDKKQIKIIEKRIKRQVFVDALNKDPYYNALRIKFGYAITCHKAQGGEWKKCICKMLHLS